MRANLYVAWSVLKLLVGIALAPALAALFFVSKRGFIAAMSFLWVHLDIYTPEGKLYLRRWFMTPKTRWYCPRFLHLILLPDAGRDPHDHPGKFTTTPLWNGYDEEIFAPRGWWTGPPRADGSTREVGPTGLGRPGHPYARKARAWETYVNPDGHTHRVQLIGPTLTWVVGWKRGKPWGFWIMHPTDPSQDVWVNSEAYGEKGAEKKSWTIDGK